uniref:Uncharacterized protein n=1 Tax=Anguilla anguilla TaxID=7936 RepID=A0A0E9T501_ANGAN
MIVCFAAVLQVPQQGVVDNLPNSIKESRGTGQECRPKWNFN